MDIHLILCNGLMDKHLLLCNKGWMNGWMDRWINTFYVKDE